MWSCKQIPYRQWKLHPPTVRAIRTYLAGNDCSLFILNHPKIREWSSNYIHVSRMIYICSPVLQLQHVYVLYLLLSLTPFTLRVHCTYTLTVVAIFVWACMFLVSPQRVYICCILYFVWLRILPGSTQRVYILYSLFFHPVCSQGRFNVYVYCMRYSASRNGNGWQLHHTI